MESNRSVQVSGPCSILQKKWRQHECPGTADCTDSIYAHVPPLVSTNKSPDAVLLRPWRPPAGLHTASRGRQRDTGKGQIFPNTRTKGQKRERVLLDTDPAQPMSPGRCSFLGGVSDQREGQQRSNGSTAGAKALLHRGRRTEPRSPWSPGQPPCTGLVPRQGLLP